MIKGFRQIAVLTVISRVLGMVRDMAFAYFFGRGALFDAWAIAFKIPNLSRRIFGEGAAASSFIPVYSHQLEADPKQANRLANTVVTAVFVVLTGVVIVSWLGIWGYMQVGAQLEETRRMLKLTSIMLPYMVMICSVAILGGILNSHQHFAMPALAPVVLNIFLIAALVLSGKIMGWPKEKMVYFVAWAVLAVGAGQVILLMIPMKRYGVMIRPDWDIRSEGVRKILTMMGPMILGLTATQINTLADDVIAKCLSGSAEKGDTFMLFGQIFHYPVWAGTVSGLFYAQRLYQFPLGVLGISLATAIYPVLSRNAAQKDYKELLQTIRRGICGALFIALPATAGMILIGRPLMRVIFERGEFTGSDTQQTAVILYFYTLGLCGYFCQQIVTRVFYSLGQSKPPAMTAVLAVAVNVCLNLILIWPMGAAGLALSTAFCSYLQVTILLILLRRRLGGQILSGWGSSILKTAAGTAGLVLAGIVGLRLMKGRPDTALWDLIRIGILVCVCGGVYLLIAWLGRNDMLSLLTGKMASRRPQTPLGEGS
jgi:putative peptidoglycan lipid II flippase